MGPYLPELISPELNLVIALFLGMGFGFVLEQAGFSDSRKLAGLFYGYDFVVLRVFFTAGVTAMVGVSLLATFGLINLDLIFVNPLFLRSALVGGAIMGVGFILGGFCPGTSVCSAAIGRIDGMVFVLGALIGIFGYTEAYPLYKDFLVADNFGPLTVPQAFGMNRGFFILLVAVVAIVAFATTTIVEDRVNKRPVRAFWTQPRPAAYAAIAVVVAAALIVMPDKKSQALATIAHDGWEVKAQQLESVPLEELAIRLLERDISLKIIDVRDKEAFEAGHIATAMNVPLTTLAEARWRTILREPGKDYLFYGATEEEARKAAVLSRELGDSKRQAVYTDGYALYRTGMQTPDQLDGMLGTFFARNNSKLEEIAKNADATNVKPPTVKKVQGGC